MVEFRKFSTKTKKDNINVLVYVSGYKIFGTVYLPMGGRLTDFLNTKGLGAEGEVFIPVTDATAQASALDATAKDTAPKFLIS